MTSDIGRVTGNALTTSEVSGGTANQGAIQSAVAGITSQTGMRLAGGDKRWRGRGVMAGCRTVDCFRRGCRVYLHQVGMIMGMGSKVSHVAGLAISTGHLACRIANPGTGCAAVTGLTTKTGMSLSGCHIRCGGGGSMTTDTECYRSHRMGMTVAIEIGAMTGITIGPCRLADCIVNQDTG